MIRHKATGELMPELKRTRGYSWWNPTKVDTAELFGKKLIGTPRLFTSRGSAHRSIVQWYSIPNGRTKGYQTHDGEYDDFLDSKPDSRSKVDLEIVIASVEITGVITK